MNYKIEATPQFATEARKLSKKYPSLKKDIALLVSQLSDNPLMGTSLDKNFYNIRLAILCISQLYMINLKKKMLQTKN